VANATAEAGPLQLHAGHDPGVALTSGSTMWIEAVERAIDVENQCFVAMLQAVMTVLARSDRDNHRNPLQAETKRAERIEPHR
jgi:hypothetical protein